MSDSVLPKDLVKSSESFDKAGLALCEETVEDMGRNITKLETENQALKDKVSKEVADDQEESGGFVIRSSETSERVWEAVLHFQCDPTSLSVLMKATGSWEPPNHSFHTWIRPKSNSFI